MNVYVHTSGMGKVVDGPGFSVYVYREVGQRHHLPHCNVRWTDGSTSQVALPSLQVFVGKALTRRAHRLLVSHIEELVAEWNRLNPREG